jgi:hypothetical protein
METAITDNNIIIELLKFDTIILKYSTLSYTRPRNIKFGKLITMQTCCYGREWCFGTTRTRRHATVQSNEGTIVQLSQLITRSQIRSRDTRSGMIISQSSLAQAHVTVSTRKVDKDSFLLHPLSIHIVQLAIEKYLTCNSGLSPDSSASDSLRWVWLVGFSTSNSTCISKYKMTVKSI